MVDVKETPKAKANSGAAAPAEAPKAAPPAGAPKGNGSPFTFMRRFAEEMDQLFEDFGLESRWHVPSFLSRGRELLRREAGLVPAEWSPKVDVFERDGRFLIRADLPGLGKDDVKVDLYDDMIAIHGERKQEKKEEREGYSYSECTYGSFYRSIPLPEGVDGSKATAEFRNGVLEVAMPAPRRDEPKSRRLEVREAK